MVLSILTKHADNAAERLQQADVQLGSIRGRLRNQGIPDINLLDDYMVEFDAVDNAFNESDSEDETEVVDEAEVGDVAIERGT